MRGNILWKVLAVIVVFFPTVLFAHKAPDDAKKDGILKQAYRIQVPFIENMGQVNNKHVSFYAKTFGGTIFVEKNGALTYNLAVKDKKGVVIKEIFTEKRIKIKELKSSPTKVNYFIGKDKSNWKATIPCYDSISLGNIYKGIDLTLKAYGNNVEKLFTVLPEENPETIRIKITGAKGLKVNEKGELEVITEPGSVKFTKPLAYQNIKGQKKTVQVAYVIYEGNTYGFKVGDYDKKDHLFIDPLLASTFIGGGGYDPGRSIAIDGTGNVYVTGYTASSNYPTPGGYDGIHNGGYYDVFVSKLDSSLSSLLASTFIGGEDYDIGISIALDGIGNVYVTGYTRSADYPTPGGCDKSFNGDQDVFVSKLDSSLSSLLASTFIGGEDSDAGRSIAIDGTGNVYVTGPTYSDDYPTDGGYDRIHNGGCDVFVSKLESGLSFLWSSTFIGGEDEDDSCSIVLDRTGDVVYITGHTYSDDYPTPGGCDGIHNGGCDVFVSKLDWALSSLLASTFIGGGSDDFSRSIALDRIGNVYVTGHTCSADYPTPGGYDKSFNGDQDVFVSRLDSTLGSLLAGTFIGGNDGSSAGYSIAIGCHGRGDVYVTGGTHSSKYPTTCESYNGGCDVFVSRLDSTLGSLLASTFIGGSSDDLGRSIATDGMGNVYVTGETESSSSFPTTQEAYDTSPNGDGDAFVVQVRLFEDDGYITAAILALEDYTTQISGNYSYYAPYSKVATSNNDMLHEWILHTPNIWEEEIPEDHAGHAFFRMIEEEIGKTKSRLDISTLYVDEEIITPYFARGIKTIHDEYDGPEGGPYPLVRFIVGGPEINREYHKPKTIKKWLEKALRESDAKPPWNVNIAVVHCNFGCLYHFPPIDPYPLPIPYVGNWNHSKVIVRDKQYVITGGHNLFDVYIKKNKPPTYDVSIHLEGDVAEATAAHFDALYESAKYAPTWFKNNAVCTWSEDYNDCWDEIEMPELPPGDENLPEINCFSLTRGIFRDESGKVADYSADIAILVAFDAARDTIFISQDMLEIPVLNLRSKVLIKKLYSAAFLRCVKITIVTNNPLRTLRNIVRDGDKFMEEEFGASEEERIEAHKRILFAEFGGKSSKLKNHNKFFLIDDIAFYIGSQNLYPTAIVAVCSPLCDLFEHGVLIDDRELAMEAKKEYWNNVCNFSKDSGAFYNPFLKRGYGGFVPCPLDCDTESDL